MDLEETRSLQNQAGTPAYRCACRLCVEWQTAFKVALPDQVRHALQRIGVDVLAPTDLYGEGDADQPRSVRVLFHFVGTILSGPDAFSFSQQFNETIHHYEVLRESPYCSIRVLPDDKSHEAAPSRSGGSDADVVCIDFRLSYPAEALGEVPLR